MDRYLQMAMAFYYFYILLILFGMFLVRKTAIQNNEVDMSHFKSYSGNTTEKLMIFQNHYNNQFQIPMVFFVVCLLTMQQHKTTSLTLILATLFITSRMIHSFIHLTSNHIIYRTLSYFSGVIIVGVMFIILLIDIA